MAPFTLCTSCGVEKPPEAFPKKRHKQCRDCRARAMRRWREEHPDKVLEYRRARAASGKTYRDNRATKFKAKYGITVDEFEEMLTKQNGGCAICGRPLKTFAFGEGKGCREDYAAVDHDHVTGRVRGILCVNHNLMLGYADDDPAVLARAIDYLKENL